MIARGCGKATSTSKRLWDLILPSVHGGVGCPASPPGITLPLHQPLHHIFATPASPGRRSWPTTRTETATTLTSPPRHLSMGHDEVATPTTSTSTDAIAAETFEWDPALILRHVKEPKQDAPFALVVLNLPLNQDLLSLVKRLWKNACTHVAADGGANHLYDKAGKNGDSAFDNLAAIVGDLDSLRPDARDYFSKPPRCTPVVHDPDQESTDFGKAVKYVRSHQLQQQAKRRGVDSGDASPPVDIVVLGGLGGRVDQAMSQLHHLYLFQPGPRYASGRVHLISAQNVTILLKPGAHRIRVRGGAGASPKDGSKDGNDNDNNDSARPGPLDPLPKPSVFGKHVGIIPLGGPSRLWTRGLEWDVADWETSFSRNISTSNHVLPKTEVVEVRTTGDVLFTIALGEWQ